MAGNSAASQGFTVLSSEAVRGNERKLDETGAAHRVPGAARLMSIPSDIRPAGSAHSAANHAARADKQAAP